MFVMVSGHKPKQVKSSRVGSQSYPSDHGRQVSRVNLTSCHRNLQVKYSVFKELTIFTSPSILRYPDITHKSLFIDLARGWHPARSNLC